jgi:uncharacterized protein (TIGR02145 family)
MMENLRAISLNDGTPIIKEEDGDLWYQAGAARRCYYDNTSDPGLINKYGALYNWYAVNTGKLAPTGWHVPSVSDWNTLIAFVEENGGKLKEEGFANWVEDEDGGATNETGFTALPGSIRYGIAWGYPFIANGSMLGYAGFFWTSVEYADNIEQANCCVLRYWDTSVNLPLPFYKSSGLSVRCIKN